MPRCLADILKQAAELNLLDGRRRANVVHLPPGCEVIVAGDLHGNRGNLARIIAYADLPGRPDRQLVLQEIIHGPAEAADDGDRSVELLGRAAELTVRCPEQVTILLSNHDVAQATGGEVSKAGRGACAAFARGVRELCGPADAPYVMEMVKAFLLSLPLAVRCPGGVLVAHSLPSPHRMALADGGIPGDPYRPEDLRRGGSVYEWIWGRDHTPDQVRQLAERLGVSLFILGHQHLDSGYQAVGRHAVVLSAEHQRGCIMEFPSDAGVTGESAARFLKRIAEL